MKRIAPILGENHLSAGNCSLAKNVQFSDGDMIVSLMDGRTIMVPLVRFPRLATASKKNLLIINYLVTAKAFIGRM